MSEAVLGVGVIGCGNIAGAYAGDLTRYPEIEFRGVADMDQDRARRLADQYGVHAYPSVDELLADPRVDIVVNLTPTTRIASDHPGPRSGQARPQ